MSKGERPQALGQSLQKSFATRWAPVGGTFVLWISLMPPLTKTCPKMVLSIKGVAFLTEDVFAKKFFGAGRDSAGGALASFLRKYSIEGRTPVLGLIRP